MLSEIKVTFLKSSVTSLKYSFCFILFKHLLNNQKPRRERLQHKVRGVSGNHLSGNYLSGNH